MNNLLLRNTIFKTLLNICNIILPLIVGPYVLRILNREYYDIFNRLNTNFQFFLIFGGLGIYAYGVREISRIREDRSKCSTFFTEMFIIGFISNILVMIVFLIYSLYINHMQMEIIISFILLFQFLNNIFNVEWINEANEKYNFIAIKSVFVRIIYVVLIFIFVKKYNDIYWYTILLTGSTVLNTVLSYIYIKKEYKFQIKNINLKKHIMPLFYIFIISNIMVLYSQMDKMLLGFFVDDKSVTTYQIPQYIASMIYSLLISVVAVSMPRISNLIANNKKEEAYNFHIYVSHLFFLLSIPALLGAAFLSPEIILLYGGNNYTDCIMPLSFFCISQLISSGNYILGEVLMYASGHDKKLLLFNFIGGIINILSNIILYFLGYFNVLTSIFTLILSYLFVFIIDYIFIKKHINSKFSIIDKSIVLYMAISLLFLPIIYGVRMLNLGAVFTSIISILLCAILYVLILYIFKEKFFIYNFKILKNKIKILISKFK